MEKKKKGTPSRLVESLLVIGAADIAAILIKFILQVLTVAIRRELEAQKAWSALDTVNGVLAALCLAAFLGVLAALIVLNPVYKGNYLNATFGKEYRIGADFSGILRDRSLADLSAAAILGLPLNLVLLIWGDINYLPTLFAPFYATWELSGNAIVSYIAMTLLIPVWLTAVSTVAHYKWDKNRIRGKEDDFAESRKVRGNTSDGFAQGDMKIDFDGLDEFVKDWKVDEKSDEYGFAEEWEADEYEGYCGLTKHVLLLIFTFGIWQLIWIYKTTAYLNRVEDEEPREPVSKLLLCMFIPFYSIYWTYKSAQRIDKLAKAKEIQSDLSTLCMILAIFIGIIPPILMQEKINVIERTKADVATKRSEAVRRDAVEELKKYKELLDSGIISQEEFDAKKKQLLDL